MDVGELAYNMYFNQSEDINNKNSKVLPVDAAKETYEDPKPTLHFLERNEVINGTEIYAGQAKADEHIDDIEKVAEILKQLCNAAWGSDWGELSPDIKYGEDETQLVLPQITVDINTRDVAEGIGGLKPRLVGIIDEVDDDGNLTGDAFLTYRQWYDCNVEFNIYAHNAKEAREYMRKLESLISVYSGYLKRKGVSEIFFLRESAPRSSLNYTENVPMRSIYYYIRLESVTLVRQSLINSINTTIGIGKLNTEKVKTLLQSKQEISDDDLFDLNFFDGDNGITYNK